MRRSTRRALLHVSRFVATALVCAASACSDSPPERLNGARPATLADPRAVPDLYRTAGASTTPNTDRQFVWPVSGWVGATDTYYGGGAHLGTADIVTAIGTPVMAARGGTVVDAGWIEVPRSGWVVKVSHGNGVVTKYSHFIRAPKVAAGAVVAAGSILGYSGRTGRAPYPHVHFAIEFWTDAAGKPCDLPACVQTIRYGVVPGLVKGAWVARGRYVPGEYGLTTTAVVTNTTTPSNLYQVRVTEANLRAYGASALNTAPAAPLDSNARYTVYEEVDGALRVDPAAQRWVARSGTVPAPAEADWVEPTLRRVGGAQAVRVAPTRGAAVIATLAPNTIVRVVGADPATGWYRALVRNAAKDLNEFGYLDSSAAVSRPTGAFYVDGIADGAGAWIYDGPDASYAPGARLAANVYTNVKTVGLYAGTVRQGGYRVYNGWYQIGKNAWVAGWKANAPQ